MEKNGKKGELIIPSDFNTQALIRKFINGQLKTLEPDYDQQTGYHYAIV